MAGSAPVWGQMGGGHLWLLESLDRFNRAIQSSDDLERMVDDTLAVALEVFACDRAWLVYPCDPGATSATAVMESTRPEYPGTLELGVDIPTTEEIAGRFRLVLSAGAPVRFGPGAHPLPRFAERFSVRSELVTALHPKVGKPWMFGLHHCSAVHEWTGEEERLLQEVGRRLTDGLTSLLAYRELRESEARLVEATRIAQVGYWDRDLLTDEVRYSEETCRIFGLPAVTVLTTEELSRRLHPEDRHIMLEAFACATSGGPTYDVEYRVVRADGDVRTMHSRGEITWREDGRPLRMFGIVQDITERKRAEEALALFRSLVDRTEDMIEVVDAETGRFLDVNETACRVHGYTREEYLGLTVMDVAPGLVEWSAGLERLRAESPIVAQDRHRRKDGSTFPVELSASLVTLDREYVVAVYRDVTDRRRAEEALALFRSLVDQTSDMIEVADAATGRFLDVNETACRVHGYTREEFLALTVPEIVAIAEPWEARLEELRRAGSQTIEREHVRKDGSRFPVEINATLVSLDREYVLAVARDISERKRVERVLLEGHNLLRSIVDGAADAIYIKDLDGRYLLINAAGAAIMGRSPADVVGRTDRELRDEGAASLVRRHDEETLAAGEPRTFEETATEAGAARTYLTTRGPYRDPDGAVLGVIGISRDVTELKRLEDQLRQSQKMEAVGRLAGGVAHDFNNLLTVIHGYSALVLSDLAEGDPHHDSLVEIMRAAERAAGLTRQLLAFSRKQVLQPRVVSVDVLLQGLASMLEPLIGETISLELVSGADVGLARVDPGQFEQTIVNLVVNAREAMPAGGRLRLETRNDDGGDVPGVVVAVTDTGHGMDETTAAHIFEPFFTTRTEGTGLGLAMAYGFVTQSGGRLDVATAPGSGTTFTIWLPRAADASGDGASPGGPARPVREALDARG